MRLDKYLSHALNMTRKEARLLVKSNQIKINENVITNPGHYINEDVDKIVYLNKEIIYKEFIYLMLNKPAGFISARADDIHQTVMELIDEEYKKYNPFPVGRLDIDTEGLLLLTNNGKLNHFLTSPNHNVSKKYYAKINGLVTKEDIELFQKGMWLLDGKGENYFSRPAKLEVISAGEISEVYITITEGKFHQVKRMFEQVGKEVRYLKRVMMKEIYLDSSLDYGQARELTDEEVKELKRGFNIM